MPSSGKILRPPFGRAPDLGQIRRSVRSHGVGLAIRSRVADQQGQTAAEYMGILLVVAVIIGALLASHIDTRIAKAAGDMVDKIAGGGGK